MKIFQYIKTVIYILAGIFIMVCDEFIMRDGGSFITHFLAIVMFCYGIEGIVIHLIKKDIKKHSIEFATDFIEVLLGFVLFFVVDGMENEIIVVSIIWSVWAIMRESIEISEAFFEYNHKIVTLILSLILSVVSIVFSVLLIKEPGEHHIHTHVILLGIELISVVSLPFIGEFEAFVKQKINKKCQNDTTK